MCHVQNDSKLDNSVSMHRIPVKKVGGHVGFDRFAL